MRLCVVGNSHIGAFKQGWRGHPTIEATFFGAGGNGLKSAVLEGRTLTVRDEVSLASFVHTSDGHSSIAIDAFDAFVVIGAGLGLASATIFLREWTLIDWPVADLRLMSRPLLAEAIRSRVLGSVSLQVADMLASLSAAPILIVPEPAPNAIITRTEDWWWSQPAVMAELRGLYADALQTIGSRYAVVLPAAELEVDETFTRPEFTRGPGKVARTLIPGVAKIKGDGDLYHMNDRYGAAMWAPVIAALASAESSVPA